MGLQARQRVVSDLVTSLEKKIRDVFYLLVEIHGFTGKLPVYFHQKIPGAIIVRIVLLYRPNGPGDRRACGYILAKLLCRATNNRINS